MDTENGIPLIDLKHEPVRTALSRLLKDKSAKRNIIWATDTYAELGEFFRGEAQLTARIVTGMNQALIQPRIAKSREAQADRTKKHAEVFTPAWICCRMNDALDEDWFGRPDVFFRTDGTAWEPAEGPIAFPEDKGHTWQKYVDSRRLEITCGEAPFLCSRYDSATGEMLPTERRIGLLDRKLRVVNENAADDAEWKKWALRAVQSVYGYEYQGDSLLIARVNVLMTWAEAYRSRLGEWPGRKELRETANVIAWNLWQMDGLKDTPPLTEENPNVQMMLNPEPEERFVLDTQDYISTYLEEYDDTTYSSSFNWRSRIPVRLKDEKEGTKQMKWDYVIGNPPYQDTTKGENDTFAPPVYHLFMDSAYEVGNKVELIHPARFLFDAGRTPKQWNHKILNDEHFKVLHYEADAKNIFPNTIIKGGVVISYRSNSDCFGAVKTFTQHPVLNSILAKIAPVCDSDNLSSLFRVQTRFNLDALYSDYPEYRQIIGSEGRDKRLRSNSFDKVTLFHEAKESAGDVAIIGVIKNKRNWRYIDKRYIDTAQDNFYSWKALVPTATGAGVFGEVITDPIVVAPETGYTQTFIGIGAFASEIEAQNLCKYIRSKFVRAMLGILKITHHVTPEVWAYVPLQDFTPASDIDWNVSVHAIDRQLYKKYGLTQEEIDFIEANVKEMAE